VSGDGSYTDALQGQLDGTGLRIAIVATRFHAEFVDRMHQAARSTLLEHGVAEESIQVVQVPGAWELPHAVKRVARTGGPDAIIALGCVIRGDTPHFDFVAGEAARGLMDVSLNEKTPVILGLLTTETREQAEERANPARQNKGREVALAALEMAALRSPGINSDAGATS